MAADKIGVKFTFEKKKVGPKFKVGDRVRVLDNANLSYVKNGTEFVISYVQRNCVDDGYSYSDYDKNDMNKKTVIDKHYVIHERLLELARQGKILIMVDENDPDKIIARNLITGEKAETKKHPKDEWNFAKGATVALERLLGTEKKEEKPKYWSGKIICIKDEHVLFDPIFIVGKVYTVSDGCIMDEDGYRKWPYHVKFQDFNEINKVFDLYQFIEYKGGAEE